MDEQLEDLFAEAAEEDVLVVDDRDAAGKTLTEQLLAARALRTEKEELEARVKEINKTLDELEPIILKQFDALGIENMRVEGVGLVYKSETVIPTVMDQELFLDWIDTHGDGGIAKRVANYQTMKSWYTDRLKRGDELPPAEVVKTFTKREVRFRKK